MSKECKGLVVTVSGLHGTGKSTYAQALAESFGLRHISAGMLFRQIADERGLSLQQLSDLSVKDSTIDRLVDERVEKEAREGSVVIDGQLPAWIARRYANIKIFLSASDKTRFERIAARDGISFKEAEELTRRRELLEKIRYKKHYNINIEDLSIYNIIFDTELLPMESNITVFKTILKEYINNVKLGGKDAK
ncbi:MAG: nucleoside monophosphate kinase [Candidatus Bathyarchaeia archaeon]